jgi:hypothetical protein
MAGGRLPLNEQGEAVQGYEGGNPRPVGEAVFLPENGYLAESLWFLNMGG